MRATPTAGNNTFATVLRMHTRTPNRSNATFPPPSPPLSPLQLQPELLSLYLTTASADLPFFCTITMMFWCRQNKGLPTIAKQGQKKVKNDFCVTNRVPPPLIRETGQNLHNFSPPTQTAVEEKNSNKQKKCREKTTFNMTFSHLFFVYLPQFSVKSSCFGLFMFSLFSLSFFYIFKLLL